MFLLMRCARYSDFDPFDEENSQPCTHLTTNQNGFSSNAMKICLLITINYAILGFHGIYLHFVFWTEMKYAFDVRNKDKSINCNIWAERSSWKNMIHYYFQFENSLFLSISRIFSWRLELFICDIWSSSASSITLEEDIASGSDNINVYELFEATAIRG